VSFIAKYISGDEILNDHMGPQKISKPILCLLKTR